MELYTLQIYLFIYNVLFTGLIKPGGTVVEGTAGNTGQCDVISQLLHIIIIFFM